KRWSQPGQQHGRRFPSLRLDQPHTILLLLVSAFLADSTQHIHSLRASGVMSSHAAKARGSDASAFFKSAGRSCTTPLEMVISHLDCSLVFALVFPAYACAPLVLSRVSASLP